MKQWSLNEWALNSLFSLKKEKEKFFLVLWCSTKIFRERQNEAEWLTNGENVDDVLDEKGKRKKKKEGKRERERGRKWRTQATMPIHSSNSPGSRFTVFLTRAPEWWPNIWLSATAAVITSERDHWLPKEVNDEMMIILNLMILSLSLPWGSSLPLGGTNNLNAPHLLLLVRCDEGRICLDE